MCRRLKKKNKNILCNSSKVRKCEAFAQKEVIIMTARKRLVRGSIDPMKTLIRHIKTELKLFKRALMEYARSRDALQMKILADCRDTTSWMVDAISQSWVPLLRAGALVTKMNLLISQIEVDAIEVFWESRLYWNRTDERERLDREVLECLMALAKEYNGFGSKTA